MWYLIRNAAAAAGSDIKSNDSQRIAALLNDMMNCRRSPESCLAELGSIAALKEKSGGEVSFRRPIPNIETAFALTMLSELENSLESGRYDAAADICRALERLPELSELNEPEPVESFNNSFIDPIVRKFNIRLLRLRLLK